MATVVADLVAKLGLKPDAKSWSRGDELINKIKKGIEFFIGFEVVKSLGEMVAHTVELGSVLNDTATKTGLTVEALQQLGYVAKLNGSSMEGVAFGVTRLSRSIVEAKKGTGPAAEAFQKLGVNINSAAFKAAPLDQKFQLVSEALVKIKDPSEKTAIAMTILGRSGADLIPTMQDLGEHGAELRAEFDELGGGLSTKQAKQLDEFGDSVDKAKFKLGNIKNQIIAQMIPALQEMLNGFMEWMKANRELISSAIEGIVRGIAVAFRVLGVAVAAVGAIFKFLKEHQDIAISLFVGIAYVILDAVVPALYTMVSAWIAALAPIVLTIAAIAAVTFGVIQIVKHWDLIKAKGVAAWRAVMSALEDFWDRIRGIGSGIKSFFVDDIPHAIVSAFEAVGEGIKHVFEDAFTWVRNLPIVKQLLDTFEFFVGKAGVAGPHTVEGLVQQTVNPGGPPSAPGVAGGASTNVTVGPPTFNISSTAADPKAVAAEANKAFQEFWNTQMQQAHEAQ